MPSVSTTAAAVIAIVLVARTNIGATRFGMAPSIGAARGIADRFITGRIPGAGNIGSPVDGITTSGAVRARIGGIAAITMQARPLAMTTTGAMVSVMTATIIGVAIPGAAVTIAMATIAV